MSDSKVDIIILGATGYSGLKTVIVYTLLMLMSINIEYQRQFKEPLTQRVYREGKQEPRKRRAERVVSVRLCRWSGGY